MTEDASMGERTVTPPTRRVRRVVIIGAGYAGVTCALRLKRLLGPDVHVSLVSPSDTCVERIRLHQRMVGQRVGLHPLSALLSGTSIELVLGHARRLDASSRSVRVGGRVLAWDHLVLATGSRAETPAGRSSSERVVPIEADDMPRVCETLGRLAARGRGSIVVVGGGLTGIETATEIAESYRELSVTLVTHGSLGRGWSPAARQHLLATLDRLGVRLRERERVVALEDAWLATDRGPLSFDLCLWATGFVADALARDSGLSVNDRGQALVDAHLRSLSHREVYVAGDLAAVAADVGPPLPMGCKTAMPTGAHVADNIARRLGGEAEEPISCRVPFFCVSLGRRDALIQFAASDGMPTGRVLTGRRGAWFKELVCRSTITALKLERLGLAAVQWPQARPAPPEGLPEPRLPTP